MNESWIYALLGGTLIGFSVTIMLLFNGRVTGISGIINGLLAPAKNDILWRVLFIAGLFMGGVVMGQFNFKIFENTMQSSIWTTAAAGLLVGFGTIMGSGCTSGHGVCGISRLSARSIVATVVFIGAGVLAVFVFKMLGALI